MTPNEPLLYEHSRPGVSGVDLPDVPHFSPRTGQPKRERVGLPEVSEPEVIRHFTRLSQMNFCIDTNFYPLGSCTMKHNPRLNEALARLPGFADLHPLAPEEDAQGALELLWLTADWLAKLTGLPGVTLAPAAGAHGELTGAMIIRKAHEARGNPRHIILVSDSAHGTNPATAAMCGYETREIPSNTEGTVNVAALEAFLKEKGESVAAFMLTNPNTCGLFEPDMRHIARLLHTAGAYFYCDGANFNAIVGKVRPADLGVDVMQLNLHKTFSTPHGGGGPGSGPVAVSEELTPFLPLPQVEKKEDGTFALITKSDASIGRVRGFHGQFGMAVRALSYMMSLGGDGLKQTAEDAVLNANYVMEKLKGAYHLPFPGPCMHECLFTDRHQRKGESNKSHFTTLDIAKLLIDKGFHPMTVYFPLVVTGAMLVEPTESESRETLDAFIAAMKEIAALTNQAGGEKTAHAAPKNTPRGRVDEVRAARKPVLRWKATETGKAKTPAAQVASHP